MQFAYTARTRAGESLEGVVAAHNAAQVRQILRDRGAMALSVSAVEVEADRPARGRRAKPRDLLGVTSQLAIMTRTGIDLATAVRTVASQCRNERLQAVLQQVHHDVANGDRVSQAMRRHAHVFGESYVAAIASGESSGKLSEVFVRLGGRLRHEIKHRSTVRQLMAYPLLLTGVSLLVLLGLILFVLPQFSTIYQQYRMPLPWTTRALLELSRLLRGMLPLLLAASAAGVGGAAFLLVSGWGKNLRDWTALHLALVRDVSRPLTTGRLLTTLGSVLQSGVPLLESVRLTRDAVSNSLFKQMLSEVEQDILNGRGLRRPIERAGFLPEGAAEMVVTGEQTGTLDEVTVMMGAFYEEQGEAKLRELAAVAEPAIIVAMGVVVGFVVISVMLPVFDMATLVK